MMDEYEMSSVPQLDEMGGREVQFEVIPRYDLDLSTMTAEELGVMGIYTRTVGNGMSLADALLAFRQELAQDFVLTEAAHLDITAEDEGADEFLRLDRSSRSWAVECGSGYIAMDVLH